MFKTELSFVKTITSSVRTSDDAFYKKNAQDKIFIKKELCLGYGIADIVIVKYQKNKQPKRNTPLSLFDISLIRLIRNNKELDIEEILKITKSSQKKVKESLSKLIKDKIIETKTEKLFSYNNYSSILTNSIAIEAKLKSWKRALHQAYRYKWFAEKSFVFLPEENISPAFKNLDLFKKMNVGLGTISKDKALKILIEPISEKPYSEEMSMFLSECVLFNLSSASKKTPKKKDDNQH